MNTLLLVDGTNLATRAWHTNNLFGFWNMLLTALSEVGATLLVVVFDNGEQSWRHHLYPAYKATRRKKPTGLLPYLRAVQMALAPEIQCFAFPEADDGLASLAHQAAEAGLHRTVILSSDKDLLQLAGLFWGVRVLSFGKHFSDRHLVDTLDALFLDRVALVGDKSDNLPGVRGIGPKTADRLLKKYGHLGAIYECLDEIAPRWARLLEAGEEAALLTRELATLDLHLDLGFGWGEWLERCACPEAALTESMKAFKRLWDSYIAEGGNYGQDDEGVGLPF